MLRQVVSHAGVDGGSGAGHPPRECRGRGRPDERVVSAVDEQCGCGDLPYDEPSGFDARVAVAFLSRAAVDPTLAEALGPAFAGFVDTLRALLHHADATLYDPV